MVIGVDENAEERIRMQFPFKEEVAPEIGTG
jgi:hypothetical protein